MKVTFEEYQTMTYVVDGITYTPEATFTTEEIDGEIKHFAEITKTAEENYQSIINQSPQPSAMEQLKQQLLETQSILAQIQYNSLLSTK